MYLGLSLALIAVAVKFFQEAGHVLFQILTLTGTDLVLIVLSLIDSVLVGSLIVMVMLCGHETSCPGSIRHRPMIRSACLGKPDSGTLKLKVAASIERALLDPPVAGLHGHRLQAQRQDRLVCCVASDIRRLGRPVGSAGPHGLRDAPQFLSVAVYGLEFVCSGAASRLCCSCICVVCLASTIAG